jgi:hypothetical protein
MHIFGRAIMLTMITKNLHLHSFRIIMNWTDGI